MKKHLSHYKRPLFIVIVSLLLTACSHINEKIDKLPYRATKIQINKILGKPFKIKRINGMDHWVYKFVIEGRHYTRTVIIKEGMLYTTESIKPYSLKSL